MGSHYSIGKKDKNNLSLSSRAVFSVATVSPVVLSVLNGQNHSPQTQLKTTRFLSLLFLKISFKTPKFDKRGHLGIAHKQKTLGYCIRRPHR